MVRGLGAVGGHDDALAGGQGVILHNVGGTQVVECGLHLVHGGAGERAGGRHADVRHDLLGERLGGLQAGRVLRRAEDRNPVVEDRVCDSSDQRSFGADHHKVDLL